MSAGTLTLTNNSAVVAGSGTAFTTELTAGDFFVITVGGVPYTLPVKSVVSDTSLTLVSNYTGPTQAGAAWYAVPRVAMNLVTAALVAQSAEALRGLNYDKQNWQQFFTAEGDVTITLPDTSQTAGPSAKKLINSMAGKAAKGVNSDITSLNGLTIALSVAQGGTGAKDKSSARINLEAAKTGDNSDITSINGLTTPLGTDQGGTGTKYAGGWFAWNDPAISAYFSFPGCTSVAKELRVQLDPIGGCIRVIGILRKPFTTSNLTVLTCNSLPPWVPGSGIISPYTVGLLGSGSSGGNAYLEIQTVVAGSSVTLSAASALPASFFMLDLTMYL